MTELTNNINEENSTLGLFDSSRIMLHSITREEYLNLYGEWVGQKMGLNASTGLKYSRVLYALDRNIKKTLCISLFDDYDFSVVQNILQEKYPQIKLNRDEKKAVIYYQTFLLLGELDNERLRIIPDYNAAASKMGFGRWLSNQMEFSKVSIERYLEYLDNFDSSFDSDSSIYDIKNILELVSIYKNNLARCDKKTKEVANYYLSYFLDATADKTEFTVNEDNRKQELQNKANFEQWLSSRISLNKRAKYSSLLLHIQSSCKQQLGRSLLGEDSVEVILAIISYLISQGKLRKDARIACILYLSFSAQKNTHTESNVLFLSRKLEPKVEDFENWFLSYMGISLTSAKKHIARAEEISQKLSRIGFTLYTVASISELKTLMEYFYDFLDESQIIVLDYYYAYLCCIIKQVSEKTSLIKNASLINEENKSKLIPSFESWCLSQSYRKATINTSLDYIKLISRFCVDKGISKDFDELTIEGRTVATFAASTHQEAYVSLMSEAKYQNCIDRYCFYLLDCCDDCLLSEELEKYVDNTRLPLLIMGDRKDIGAKFSLWLKDNNLCEANSARTFVSSLYSCENIAIAQYDESIFNNKNKCRIAYLRYKIIKNRLFKKNYIRPLRLYIQFLSSFNTVSLEEYEKDKVKLNRLINVRFGGQVSAISNSIYEQIYYKWNEEYQTELLYSKEQIVSILQTITIFDSNHCVYITRESFLPENIKNTILKYIHDNIESGCPIIEYKQIKKLLPHKSFSVTLETLRQYLSKYGEGIYICDKKGLRVNGSSKLVKGIPTVICNKLREQTRPVTKQELLAILKTISEDSINKVLAQNYTLNVGIINPKRGKLFHADIISISKNESSTIINLITDQLNVNYFITTPQLFKIIKEALPSLFKRYPYLTQSSLYSVLRYKLGEYFKFNISCITFSENVDIPSIFQAFCKRSEKFTISELERLEKELGIVGIPFEHIYEISARISFKEFIRKEKLHFDIKHIDDALEYLIGNDFFIINQFHNFHKLPPVHGVVWTSFLLEHYLTFHSERFNLITRGFAKTSSYGFIVRQSIGITDFNEAIAKYLILKNIELDTQFVLSHLYESGVIAARRYSNIGDIIYRVQQIKGL